MRRFAHRFPLVMFFGLAYAIAWTDWLALALRHLQVAPGSRTTHFPGLLAPAIAACLTPLIAGDTQALKRLAGRLLLVSKPQWRFWMVGCSPILFLVPAFVAAKLTGGEFPAFRDFSLYPGAPEMNPALLFILVLVGNGFGEETGWRGFALPRLQAKLGPLGGTMALWVLWACWHAPMFVVNETFHTMTPSLIIGGFGLGILSGAIVLSHVSHLTGGSVLAVAFWHAAYNMTSATVAGRGLVAAASTTCVMTWATVVLILEVRRPRGASILQVPEGSRVLCPSPQPMSRPERPSISGSSARKAGVFSASR